MKSLITILLIGLLCAATLVTCAKFEAPPEIVSIKRAMKAMRDAASDPALRDEPIEASEPAAGEDDDVSASIDPEATSDDGSSWVMDGDATSSDGKGSEDNRNHIPHQSKEDPTLYDPPGDHVDWALYDGTIYYSATADMFFDRETGHYFDSATQHWYNPWAKEWYPQAAQEDAEQGMQEDVTAQEQEEISV